MVLCADVLQLLGRVIVSGVPLVVTCAFETLVTVTVADDEF
jgi:hypothetical protein